MIEVDRYSLVDQSERLCLGCKKTKDKYQFYVMRKQAREDRGDNPYHLDSQCKECHKVRQVKTWPTRRGSQLMKYYGIGLKEYDQMLTNQGGVCKICGEPPEKRGKDKYLPVDHCHTTKKIRGLLCKPCNVGLGAFLDSPKLLDKAKEYLKC